MVVNCFASILPLSVILLLVHSFSLTNAARLTAAATTTTTSSSTTRTAALVLFLRVAFAPIARAVPTVPSSPHSIIPASDVPSSAPSPNRNGPRPSAVITLSPTLIGGTTPFPTITPTPVAFPIVTDVPITPPVATPPISIPSSKPSYRPTTNSTTNNNSTRPTTPTAPTSNRTNITFPTTPRFPTPAPLKPTLLPTKRPTESPTSLPSDSPSAAPSFVPSISSETPTTVPSAAPSSAPSSPPSSAPSSVPTRSPTKRPSKSPTVSPTFIPNNETIVVKGQVNVVLAPVNGTMDAVTLELFLNATSSFFNASFNSSQVKQFHVDASEQFLLSSSSRNRQRGRRLTGTYSNIVPLQVLVQVLVPPGTNATTSTNASSPSFFPNLNTTLSALVSTQGSKFVKSLQATKDPYLANIQTVTSTSTLPTLSTAPVSSPTPIPNSINNPTSAPSKKKGLDSIVYIGIGVAVAIVIVIVIIALLIRRRINSTLNSNTSDNLTFASMPATVGGGPAGAGNNNNNNNSYTNSNHGRSKASSSQSSFPDQYQSSSGTQTSPSSYQQQQSGSRQRRSTAASQNSAADTHSDYGSELMGTDNHSDRGDTAGGDTMSYTYSLDAGLTDTFEGTSTISGTASTTHAPVPTSIPHITNKSRDDGGDDDDAGILDDDDDLELELGSVASSTLVGASGGNARVADQYITRECWAPPGKLGIVIDTTLEGPVVHKVNPGSPLEGVVWPGDIIIAIDNVDTRAMSASAITQLMIKTAKSRRKLTILSDATK